MTDTAAPERTADKGAAMNTDRQLWRELGIMSGDCPSIHVTKEGGIGINVGGFVIVKTLRQWHALAMAADNLVRFPPIDRAASTTKEG